MYSVFLVRSLSEQSSKTSTFSPLVAWHCSLAIRNSNAFDLSNSSAWKSFLAHPELGLLQLGEAEAEEAFGSRFIVFDPRKKNKSEEVTAGLLPPYNMLHVMISCASRIWISPEGWSLQKTCELLQHGANSPAKMYTSAQSPVKQCSLLTDLTIVQKPKLAKIIKKHFVDLCCFCFQKVSRTPSLKYPHFETGHKTLPPEPDKRGRFSADQPGLEPWCSRCQRTMWQRTLLPFRCISTMFFLLGLLAQAP